MRQFFTVLRFEFLGKVRTKGYVILTGAFALILLAVACLPLFWGLFSSDGGQEDSADLPDMSGELEAAACYDPSGDYTPEILSLYLPGYNWVLEDSEQVLSDKIESGEYAMGIAIAGVDATVYLKGTDTLYANYTIYTDLIRSVSQSTLLAQAGVDQQTIAQVQSISTSVDFVTVGRDTSQSYFLALAVSMLLYFSIAFYGATVSGSVSTEKTSKAMELLTISASPYALMFGKVIGTALAGLLQFTVILLPAGAALYAFGDAWMSINPAVGVIVEMILSSGLLGYAVVFFLLGFFTYAFLYGALASGVTRIEDVSGSQSIPTLLLMFAYLLSIYGLMSAGTSTLVRVFSFVPFFSPLVMFMRISLTEVATWEIMTSIGLSLLYVLILGYCAAKIYRVCIMVYGNKPKLRNLIGYIRQA